MPHAMGQDDAFLSPYNSMRYINSMTISSSVKLCSHVIKKMKIGDLRLGNLNL